MERRKQQRGWHGHFLGLEDFFLASYLEAEIARLVEAIATGKGGSSLTEAIAE